MILAELSNFLSEYGVKMVYKSCLAKNNVAAHGRVPWWRLTAEGAPSLKKMLTKITELFSLGKSKDFGSDMIDNGEMLEQSQKL